MYLYYYLYYEMEKDYTLGQGFATWLEWRRSPLVEVSDMKSQSFN